MRFCLEIVVTAAVVGNLAAASLPVSEGTRPATAVDQGSASLMASRPSLPVWVVKVDTRTGKLVRRLVGPAKRGTDADVQELIAEAAKNFDVNPLLVDSVIQVESNYNPFAVSPKGAQGLMQLMPGTAQRFGVTDSFDAKQNIEGGVRYLKFLEDTFQDDRLAIAAYNAGEKAVTKYKGVPPYPETVSYVAKVESRTTAPNRPVRSGDASKATAKAASAVNDDGPRHIQTYMGADGRLYIATR